VPLTWHKKNILAIYRLRASNWQKFQLHIPFTIRVIKSDSKLGEKFEI
jgi:hypothetical protein